MRVYIDMGYSLRGVADVTSAELETFCRVMDKIQATSAWYGTDRTIELKQDRVVEYNVRLVPGSVTVAQVYSAVEEPAAA